MSWKKLLAWATCQIDQALRQKLEFVSEENHVCRARLNHIHLTRSVKPVE